MIKTVFDFRLQSNFFKKIELIPFHECWEWNAAKNEKGYGVFGFGKDTDKAHRISYRLLKGPIPDGKCLLHSCDNPGCVNPRHLSVGTKADNNRDMFSKGRGVIPYMAGHNRKQICEKDLQLLGRVADTDLARRNGCTKKVIQRLRHERGIPAFPRQTRFKKERGSTCPTRR